MEKYSALVKKICSLGEKSPLIDAVVVIGSYARTTVPADEFSDLDLLLFVKNTDAFVNHDDWLHTIENYYISFVENTIGGLKERRILFENCLDVDFIIVPSDYSFSDEFGGIFSRGYHVLLDKEDICRAIRKIKIPPKTVCPVSEEDFINRANDFWYHAVWTGKKIKRGELWTAKSRMDSYMRNILLLFIESYAKLCNGMEYDTWHNGRMLETWVDTRIAQKLPSIFSEYDKDKMVKALFSMMELFRFISIPIAKYFSYEYPQKADDYATAWLKNTIL